MSIMISKFNRNKALYAYSFIFPAIVFLFIFWVYPVLISIGTSFFKWDIVNPRVFVGFDNYRRMMTDYKFWNSVRVTFVYVFSTIIPTMFISLLLASLLNRSIFMRALLRSIYFLPWTIAFIAISLIWKWMFNPSFGLFNQILSYFGLSPVNWLRDPRTALSSIIILGIWWAIGYDLIIYLAALQSIDTQLYEAAVIDGANNWQKFWNITWPGIREANVFVIIVSMIHAFQIFDSPYAMTGGGPAGKTETIVLYIYKIAMRQFKFGYACTLSVFLFVVVLLLSIISLRLFTRE